MKRWLIIGYFVILVAIIIGLTLTCIGEGYPLWTLISMPLILGLLAISILLYGLSYKPKHFAWFWKIVPLVLVAYYASSWYFAGSVSVDTKGSVLSMFLGIAFLFPAFYLSFKFGYSKSLPAGKSSPKFITFIFVVTVLCVASRYLPSPKPKVNIKVNSVAEYNKITKPVNYDPNENATLYYEKAFELSVESPERLSKSDRKGWPEDLSSEKQILLQEWVSANSDALEQLKLGTQRSYYWLEHKGSCMWDAVMPSLAKARGLMHAICSRAKLNATEGNFKAAFSDLLVCYQFGKYLTGPKTLVDQLVGIAISANAAQTGLEILDRTELPSDLLEDFQRQLSVLSAKQSHVVDFTFYKLLIYDYIQRIFTDDGKGSGHVYGTRFLENPAYLESLLGLEPTAEQRESFKKVERQQAAELTDEMFEYFSRQAHKTPWYLHNEGTDLKQIIEEMTKDNPLVQILTPNAGRVMEISFRVKVHTDALITTLALLRYKADKGRFPENLNQLVTAGYLKGLPLDPFSDNPLVYKRIGDDFMLYSFGADFDDDGGTYSRWGRGEKGGDQVFWPVSRKQK